MFKELTPIIPNVILVIFWHLTPIIMNDSDGLPSKASTSNFGFTVNRFGLHWHTICINLLHYMKFGQHFVSVSLLRLWIQFRLRGTVVGWDSGCALWAAADTDVSSIT